MDARRISLKLAGEPEGSPSAYQGRRLCFSRPAQVGGRDTTRGRLHRRRDGCYHRTVSANDRALLPTGEPEEARGRRDPQMGTVAERWFVKRIVKLPLDQLAQIH